MQISSSTSVTGLGEGAAVPTSSLPTTNPLAHDLEKVTLAPSAGTSLATRAFSSAPIAPRVVDQLRPRDTWRPGQSILERQNALGGALNGGMKKQHSDEYYKYVERARAADEAYARQK